MFYSLEWDKLKNKHQDALRMEIFADAIEEGLLSRIEYVGLPDKFIELQMKKLLLRRGACALYRNKKGEFEVGAVSFAGGDMYFDGVLSRAIVVNAKGEEFTFEDWRNSDEVVVHFYNSTHTPNFKIMKYAHDLAEIEKSQEVLITYARAHGFIVAEDEEQATQIKKGIKDVNEGKLYTLVSNALSNSRPEMLEIGDVGASKWLSDLDIHFHTVASRLYFLEGCELGTTIKKAQQTADEVNRGFNASRIICEDILKCAREFCEECSKLGLTVTCDFSDCWKIVELSDESGFDEDGDGDVEQEEQSEEQSEEEVVEDDNKGNSEED